MGMWDDFTDFELATLCGNYHLNDLPDFADDFSLKNRPEVEQGLTEYEMNLAFGEKDVDLIPELL